MSFRTAVFGLAAITLFAVSPGTVSAQTITFTHTGALGSGSIDGSAFVRKAITFSASGNVLDRQSYASGFFIDHTSASITIEDIGTYTFVTATRTYINNNGDQVGFSRAGTQGADLFNGPRGDALAGWDMLSSIGPIAGDMFLTQWTNSPVVTSGGTLVFEESQTTGTFTAVVGTVVPEPSTIALVGVAIVLLGVSGRVRGRGVLEA